MTERWGSRGEIPCDRCGGDAGGGLSDPDDGARLCPACFNGDGPEAHERADQRIAEEEAGGDGARPNEAPGEGASDRAERDTTWAPLDLGPVLSGGGDLELPPAYLARSDGERLLYPRKVHILFGEPETTKGWLACAACRERMLAGEHVLYIDFDDQDPAVIVSRLRALAVPDELIRERFHYVAPDEPLDDAGRAEILALLGEHEPTLAVLDGFTDALTLHGVQVGDNTEIARWMRGLPKLLRERGPAVVIVDHVVKDRERRGGYSLGGQHKRAKADVSYEIVVVEPWGRDLTGRSLVKVWKDRPGHVKRLGRLGGAAAQGGVVAQFVGQSLPGGGLDVALEQPPEKAEGHKRLTGYMEKVSLVLEGAPEGLNVGEIRAAVEGKAAYVDRARQDLINERFVRAEKRGTEHVHISLRRYREAADNGPEEEPDEGEFPW